MASCFPEEEYFDPRSNVIKGSIGGGEFAVAMGQMTEQQAHLL